MAYNVNFPNPLDFLRDSQPLILGNFQALPPFIAVDHYTFADPNVGKHKWSTYTQQNKDTLINTSPNDWILFQALSSLTATTQLFSKDSTDALLNFSDALTLFNFPDAGWFSLPSGIIIKYQKNTITFANAGGVPPGQFLKTHTWLVNPQFKPFTNQHWATIVPAPSIDFVTTNGSPLVCYVNRITDPTKIEFNIWVSSYFNNQQTFPHGSFVMTFPYYAIAIGE